LLKTQVRPFVEAMFQRHVHATSVAVGSNPSWNEELCIPFRFIVWFRQCPFSGKQNGITQWLMLSLYLSARKTQNVDSSLVKIMVI